MALWENFRDFIAAVAEHVSYACVSMHCGKISAISLRRLPSMCCANLCVSMHCGKISAISLRPLPESCELCVCAVWHCGKISAISLRPLPSMI